MAAKFSQHNDGTFDPNEMQKRVDRLKKDGRLPLPEEFLKALQEAILETDIEKTDPS